MATIYVYEDNAGQVYLAWGSEVWGLGPVTRDMYGTAAEHCAAWIAGDGWVPNEADGQTRENSIDNLTPIGRYTNVGGDPGNFEDYTRPGTVGRLFVHGEMKDEGDRSE